MAPTVLSPVNSLVTSTALEEAAAGAALRDKATADADEQYLRKPVDGRPFLISNFSAQQLAGRFRRWSWLHLGIFFAALIAAIQ